MSGVDVTHLDRILGGKWLLQESDGTQREVKKLILGAGVAVTDYSPATQTATIAAGSGLVDGDAQTFTELRATGGLTLSVNNGIGMLSAAQIQDALPSWRTVYEVDFTTVASTPMLANGNYTIGSGTAQLLGAHKIQAGVPSAGLINGVGLAIPPSSATQLADNWDRPSVVFRLNQFWSGFNLLTPIRASFISSNSGNAANDVSHSLVIGVGGTTAEATTPAYTINAQGIVKRMGGNTPVTAGQMIVSRAGGLGGGMGEAASDDAKAMNQFRLTSLHGIAIGNMLIEGSPSLTAWDTSPALVPFGAIQGYGLQNNVMGPTSNILLSQFARSNAFVALLFTSNGAAVVPPAITALKIEMFY